MRDVVIRVRDEGDHYAMHLQSGDVVLARRVLIAVGACSAWPGLLPNGLRLDAEAMTQTTLLAEVSEHSAHHQFSGMPSISLRDYWKAGSTNTQASPSIAYLLPPIRYPDGRWYMKIGHGKMHDTPLPASRESIAQWYRHRSDNIGAYLFDVLRMAIPSILPLSLRVDSCVTLTTPTGGPYIDSVPGTSRSNTLFVATGGNGKSAKTSDELGRLAAGLLVGNTWLSNRPHTDFQARFVDSSDRAGRKASAPTSKL